MNTTPTVVVVGGSAPMVGDSSSVSVDVEDMVHANVLVPSNVGIPSSSSGTVSISRNGRILY